MESLNDASILLVEDDAMIALSTKAFLEREGFKVFHTFSGEDSIEFLQNKTTSIDIILMDIDLGDDRILGTEAAEIILKNFLIPLVFLSSHTEKEIVEKTENITSYGYIVKHSGNTVLLASIKMALKLFSANKKLKENEIALKKSEESLLRTIHSIGDGFIATDYEGKITLMNPVAEKLCGWNLNEAIGLPLEEVFFIINSTTRKSVENPVKKVLSTGQIVGLANHTVLISKDKFEYQIADSASPIYNTENEIAGVVLIFSDITDKYRKEAKINFLASLLENVQDAVISTDTNFNITSWNQGATLLYGYKEEEVIGKFAQDIFQSTFKEGEREKIVKEFEEKGRWIGEVIHLKNDGTKIQIQSSVSKILNEEGKYIGAVSINRDLTEIKIIEEKLKFQSFAISNVNDAIIITDEKLEITQWNKGAELLYGWNEKEAIGKKIDAICKTEFTSESQIRIQNEIIKTKKWDGELIQYNRNNDRIWVIASVTILEDEKNRFIGGVTINHDITQRKQSEFLLQENQKRLTGIIESAMDGIISINETQEIILFNSAAEKIFGYSKDEILGQNINKLIPKKFHETHPNNIKEFGNTGVTTRTMNALGIVYGVRSDGTNFPIESSISQIILESEKVFTIILRDITEKTKRDAIIQDREDKLKKAQKLSKVGSWNWDVEDGKVYWSDEMFEIFEISKEEFDNSLDNSINVFHPDDRDLIKSLTEKAISEKKPQSLDVRVLLKNGTIRYVHGEGEMQFDKNGNLISMSGTYQDTTDSKLAEMKIQELLTEKEILLKEVHHRIKNNMQSIIGLLNVKKSFIEDQKTNSIIQETINQIHGMGLLYDKLYRSTYFTDVSAKDYIAELVQNIVHVNSLIVKINLYMELDDFLINTKTLFPLGIIINEVITNSVKYAFIANNENKIHIKMIKKEKSVKITIQDNGSGFIEQTTTDSKKGFGLTLINILAKQMKAEYNFTNKNGTNFEIELDVT